jgi:hypothetical protein
LRGGHTRVLCYKLCLSHVILTPQSREKNLGSTPEQIPNRNNQRFLASLNMTKARILDFGFPTLD